MRAVLVAATLLCGCKATTGNAPPGPAGGSMGQAAVAPARPGQFPRGYDAVSYALDLSLLDASGSFEGALTLEVVARRPGLTKEDWLAAHELAHQWWGNAATCPTWGDFWIQEAFAVFMTAAYKERRWGRAAYERERELNSTRYEAFRASGGDGPLALGPDARSGQLARKLVYGKGPRVLYVLREEIGDRAFWSAVRAFTQAAVRDGSRTMDLRQAFERAAGRPLPIFDRAVYGSGTP